MKKIIALTLAAMMLVLAGCAQSGTKRGVFTTADFAIEVVKTKKTVAVGASKADADAALTGVKTAKVDDSSKLEGFTTVAYEGGLYLFYKDDKVAAITVYQNAPTKDQAFVTPRGIKLGADKSKVYRKYGANYDGNVGQYVFFPDTGTSQVLAKTESVKTLADKNLLFIMMLGVRATVGQKASTDITYITIGNSDYAKKAF